MNKQIDHFIITDTSDRVVVDYKRSSKDNLDTALTLTLGILISVATYLLLRKGFHSTSYVILLAGLAFAIQSVILLLSGISRLLQGTGNILVINKTTNTLKSKHNPLTTKSFSLDKIQTLEVRKKKGNIAVGDGQKMTRNYCNVTAKLNDGSDVKLFTINTNRFFRSSDIEVESELNSIATQLTNEIRRHLKPKDQVQLNNTNQSNP